MISTAEFYGGAKDIGTASSSYSITDTSIRVHRASWTSGSASITLPPLSTQAVAEIAEGGPAFYIVNDGSVSITMSYGTTGGLFQTFTLATNRTALILVSEGSITYTVVILNNA